MINLVFIEFTFTENSREYGNYIVLVIFGTVNINFCCCSFLFEVYGLVFSTRSRPCISFKIILLRFLLLNIPILDYIDWEPPRLVKKRSNCKEVSYLTYILLVISYLSFDIYIRVKCINLF